MESLQDAVAYVKSKFGNVNPQVGIICGSGLGGLQHVLGSDKIEVQYKDIPGFARSTVAGHEGKLVYGTISNLGVVIMVGRLHFFEGYTMDQVTFPTKVMSSLGINTLIVTNAAGGLNPDFNVGDLVVLEDHLNIPGMCGTNPLRGPNDETVGPRFTPLSDTYDLHLRAKLFQLWDKFSPEERGRNRKLYPGVYAFVSGPTYETRAECRMLRTMGADVVGMSTVPEILVAKHRAMKILAISLVTNCALLDRGLRGNETQLVDKSADELAVLLTAGAANHEEVLEASREVSSVAVNLVRALLEDLAAEAALAQVKTDIHPGTC